MTVRKFYTVKVVAEMFGRDPETIYRWIKEGIFPQAFKVKDGWFVPDRDIRRLMKQRQESPRPENPADPPPPRRPAGKRFVTRW